MENEADRRMGYANPEYARSLAAYGEPLHLPRSGGTLLKRRIPGTPHFDAMGCYPLFFCKNWDGLAADLSDMKGELVSVTLVADPYGSYTAGMLENGFDLVRPFKQHYIVDLEQAPDAIGTGHHRKAARRAQNTIHVEVCRNPAGFTEEWSRLYGNLTQRHGIRGIRAFSRDSFARQLAMPEIVVHQAFQGTELVGAQLYFIQDEVVYCHLGAVNENGYKAGAFYALDAFSLGYFAESARKLDLGGGAGLSDHPEDGLSRYKAGWASETRPVYLCGLITDPAPYAALSRDKATDYFPAYRSGEFG